MDTRKIRGAKADGASEFIRKSSSIDVLNIRLSVYVKMTQGRKKKQRLNILLMQLRITHTHTHNI